MPVFAFNRLVEVFGSLKGKKVAFLGVSYRGDVGDTRYTPVETLVIKVREAQSEILLHDPYVSFWQEQGCTVESNIDNIFNASPDIIIISTGHKDYKKDEILQKIMVMDSIKIFDTIGLLSEDQISALQKKHTVSILGRGDIN
jgi:UDP-N-acetyl-D-mannosaminuronate dehydrogenase